MAQSVKTHVFNVRDLTLNKTNELELNGFQVSIFHNDSDPISANRVKVWNKNIEVEFFPSKGLSIAQVRKRCSHF